MNISIEYIPEVGYQDFDEASDLYWMQSLEGFLRYIRRFYQYRFDIYNPDKLGGSCLSPAQPSGVVGQVTTIKDYFSVDTICCLDCEVES